MPRMRFDFGWADCHQSRLATSNFQNAAFGRHFFETFDGRLICVNGHFGRRMFVETQ